MESIVPFLTFFDHGIDDSKQFSHRGDQGYLFGFPYQDKTRVEGFKCRVETNCAECRHIQSGSHTGTPAKNRAPTTHFARISVNRGDAHKSTYLSSSEVPEFRNVSQQACNGRWAYTFDRTEQCGQINKMLLNVLFYLNINEFKLAVQCTNKALNAFHHYWMGGVKSVSFCNKHPHQLSAASYQSGQNLTLIVRQGQNESFSLRMVIDYIRHLGERSGINAIGFRKVSHRPTKISGLSGVNNSDFVTFSLKTIGHWGFKAACSLHQNQRNRDAFQGLNYLFETIGAIYDSKRSFAGSHANIEGSLSNINTNTDLIWLTHYYPSLHIRIEVPTTVRVSDEWLSSCAIGSTSGFLIPWLSSSCMSLAKSFRCYFNRSLRYKAELKKIVQIVDGYEAAEDTHIVE